MERIKAMVDMSLTETESAEMSPVPVDAASRPRYPYGLCISLCSDELEKLGLADLDLEPGDMLHFHAMATVTSVSMNQRQDAEDHCRVELQITAMSAESEDEENNEEDKKEDKGRLKKLYL